MNKKRCNGKEWLHKWESTSGRRVCSQCGAVHWSDFTESERFFLHVDRRGPDDCWLWTGHVLRGGYGDAAFRGKTRRAHQIAFFLANGYCKTWEPSEKWMKWVIAHSCDVKLCCNSKHLRETSQKDNLKDVFARGRKRNVLTPDQVHEIRHLASSGYTNKQISEQFGYRIHAVWGVTSGRCFAGLNPDKVQP